MTKRLHDVGAVLFDAVGTLIRPAPPAIDVYYAAGQRFGATLTRPEVAARFAAALRRAQRRDLPVRAVVAARGGASSTSAATRGTSSPRSGTARRFSRRPTNERKERLRWRQIVADVFDGLPAAKGPLFEHLWDHFANSRHWAFYDDVPAVWRELKRRAIIVGVASNFDRRLAQVCRGLPPLSRCRHVYWSSLVGWPKPSSRFFRTIQRRLELPPEQILLVGNDWVNDVQGARSAGWQALHLDREGKSDRGSLSRLDALLGVLAP